MTYAFNLLTKKYLATWHSAFLVKYVDIFAANLKQTTNNEKSITFYCA